MAALTNSGIKTCKDLLSEYFAKNIPIMNPIKLDFQGVGSKDVYNITAPFKDAGVKLIAGRVESRESEHSEAMFFSESDGQWLPHLHLPVFTLQDPFYTRINNELVLGGVQISPHPTQEHALLWRTAFYKGTDVSKLQPFFVGPQGMKDLRLVQLKDGSIGIFTRPQGQKGGRGKIGFTSVASLADLSIEIIEQAPLLTEQFTDTEWGGVNEAHLLSNGLIGLLGHIACFDEHGDRHYYPMVFAFDPVERKYSNIELIGTRGGFLPGASKRPDLVDVVFSGGLVRHSQGLADLYAGISDAEAHRITIPDPFIKFET